MNSGERVACTTRWRSKVEEEMDRMEVQSFPIFVSWPKNTSRRSASVAMDLQPSRWCPAGFAGSRFLFFVRCLWLLIKHPCSTNWHPCSTNWPGDLQAGGSSIVDDDGRIRRRSEAKVFWMEFWKEMEELMKIERMEAESQTLMPKNTSRRSASVAPLVYPSHNRTRWRPAGFAGSRFLSFVSCLWLLIKHPCSTNWTGDLQAGGSGSTISFPSSPSNGIMSTQASSDFAVGRYALGLGAGLNDMLASPRSTARARGHGGRPPVFVDATGGRYLVIHINTPQQGNQGAVAAAQEGPGDLAQRALQSLFGGLVPLCFTLLLGDNNGTSPGYIKAAICAGLGLVTVFTYLGLFSKKRAKAAIRVVASTAMAALSIALVYTVSDNVYIKYSCGIIGAVATVATMAIDW